MGRTKKIVSDSISNIKLKPALTPEAREQQLIYLAQMRAEEQLLNGTASSQVITHFLKLGTEREKLQNEKLKNENELLKSKSELIQSTKRSDELYDKAMKAMRSYAGVSDDEFSD